MTMQFKKAVKHDAKGRVAFIGPAGGGKSMTSLVLARALAGPQGSIAAIDTEHGSLSKYADLFQFDVIDLDVTSPENFLTALDAAEAAKYDVFMVDSLSHFWMGKGGALEFVDMAAKRHRDQMGGWKDFRPMERAMVDRMIASPCHIIVTMRTKTDYAEVTENGKKKRVKVGLAPVQRDGLEYEFDLVAYMDDENNFLVDKSRCPALAQKAFNKPTAADFVPFINWLSGVKREDAPAAAAATSAETSQTGVGAPLTDTTSTATNIQLSDREILDHRAAIEACIDIDALKSTYGVAWKLAKRNGDAKAMASFEQCYGLRKSIIAARHGVVA